ncbi:MAG TPA: T9SS type A sorting domain-containing protein, partial [Catalimonadaceae bacterium]|nr:T9SS type A sorting domain-containing protein [Catalimonadaceae bacterium]
NPITTVPTGFRFWYKYAPIPGDTGLAELMILDQYLNRIGGARILLTAQTNYTEVFQPVEMESDSTPYFMTVYFSTFTSQNENKQPQLGTRLLLDDVEVTGLTSIAKPKSMKQTMVWPNPVSSTLFYNFEGTALIYNALGKLVLQSSETRLADVSPLPSGVYSIIFGNTTQGSVRFVKQ